MVEEASQTESQQPESLEYRTEVKQLLDILAHSLYTDREIFLRELISNSSDALNRLQFEMLTNPDVVDAEQEPVIELSVDPEARTLTLRDTGVGMNHDELIENLGTIAHSGAKKFLERADEGKATLEEIIGQFGVGFYSVFMVAEEVEVVSRSFRHEDRAWAWRSRGDSSFTLTPVDEAPRGTTITVKFKEDAAEFAQAWRVEQIVKQHSDYVSFPIYLMPAAPKAQESDTETETAETATEETATEETEAEQEAEQPRIINQRTALWRQSPSKVERDEYIDFYRQLTYDTEEPLLHIHLVTDAPVNVRAVLYVPSRRERGMMQMQPQQGIRLYSRKILIQRESRDLLPDYLRFVEGVVDSEDLPLNVSRETVQSSPIMRQLQRALTNRLHRELKTLADEDPAKYARFWEEFGLFIKEGVALDMSNQEPLVELLRFHTTKSEDQLVSLAEYVGRMKPDQKAIYYVLGEDMKSVARSPHLDYFRAHDLEVLYLVDPIDGYMVAMLREFQEKPLQNVDDAGLELPEDEEQKDEAEKPESEELGSDTFEQLVARIKSVLGDRVRDVQPSKQLVNSPCRLVSPADSFDRDLQRLRRLTEEDYQTPAKVLELNRRHPMVVNLGKLMAEQADDPVVDASIEQLFDNALLLEGLHSNPVDMVERIQLLMSEAVARRAKGE